MINLTSFFFRLNVRELFESTGSCLHLHNYHIWERQLRYSHSFPCIIYYGRPLVAPPHMPMESNLCLQTIGATTSGYLLPSLAVCSFAVIRTFLHNSRKFYLNCADEFLNFPQASFVLLLVCFNIN